MEIQIIKLKNCIEQIYYRVPNNDFHRSYKLKKIRVKFFLFLHKQRRAEQDKNAFFIRSYQRSQTRVRHIRDQQENNNIRIRQRNCGEDVKKNLWIV